MRTPASFPSCILSGPILGSCSALFKAEEWGWLESVMQILPIRACLKQAIRFVIRSLNRLHSRSRERGHAYVATLVSADRADRWLVGWCDHEGQRIWRGWAWQLMA